MVTVPGRRGSTARSGSSSESGPRSAAFPMAGNAALVISLLAEAGAQPYGTRIFQMPRPCVAAYMYPSGPSFSCSVALVGRPLPRMLQMWECGPS